MATTIISRLSAWLQQESSGLGLREIRADGREPAALPAASLRMISSGGREPLIEQELELKLTISGARPADLAGALSELTALLRSRISRFCLEQTELRSLRWLETQYPRPVELPGGPVLASSVTRLGLTLLSGSVATEGLA
jgi:hypothetical protein